MPSAAEQAFQEASAHFAAGRVAEAVAGYRRAAAADARNPAILFNLALALRRQGALAEAAAALRAAERLAPRHEKVMAMLLDVVAEWAHAGGGAAWPPVPAADAAFSIVVCSIDAAREAAMRAHYGRLLAGREHEIVVIHDARSLAEGYTRGLAQARHALVAFSHDDVEFVSPDPFGRLAAALGACDIVGLAGATRVTGPAVGWAGHPHLHGWLAYPAGGGGFDATAYSLEVGLVRGMQGLDGLFFAARREAALRIGFDAQVFDGFHFYDLDFTYRAQRAGLALAITTDVVAVHQSRGHFGADWERYRARFQAKFPGLRDARGANYAASARVNDREALVRFYGGLRAIAAA